MTAIPSNKMSADGPAQNDGARIKVDSIWKRYWRAYGGKRAVLSSRYFWSALALTLLCYPFWNQQGWWETPVSILPDLLGFTLGGMAILIGICEARVAKALSWREPGQSESDLAVIVSTFAHFVIVQGFALVAALLCKSLYVPLSTLPFVGGYFVEHSEVANTWATASQAIGWGGSYLLFMYSILLIFATTLELFRVSTLLELIFAQSETPQAGESDNLDSGNSMPESSGEGRL